METASILAFFKQNNAEVACVLIASDLIAQAEHDVSAQSILITAYVLLL